ncbi:MAG TPA: MtnX-like HAD-IB family phosphatase [Blastocatellia bacterium]|nr:MtnX-like HAD-IB family phosphatase [Blastocatellia bacterium]
MSIILFDFDGTITKRDTTDAVLEAFAMPPWQEIEEEWVAGRIGSRECMSRQLALVNASEAELNELLDSLDVDEHFPALLDFCDSNNIEAHIISDGFDYFIKRILGRRSLGLKRALSKMTISASHLEFKNGRIVTSFPFYETGCAHGCATCKPTVMKNLNPENQSTIFVGDGLSDRFAAAAADVVFAKKKLLAHCRTESIPCFAYEDMGEILTWMRERESPEWAGALSAVTA